ncbi:hypothetical protein CA54_40860 [Symmachiella macrocystis]|uniref:SF3 helicase domain-containing protein n=1 Tax=Symmachiella macrocystis TaxID=2527985 RepID=A0A5C6BC37_9PLAN|nr:phage/plasmid primase, P4 family [Symmachiella macrocystis]TWU08849.1 hypothetical protein CA54_40860 [Symmachiella macrocystis]
MTDTATMDDPRLKVEAALQPHHIEQLRASGLTDETILACKFKSENRIQHIRLILQHKTFPKKCGSCLIIPYYDHNGDYTAYQRVRPDTPRTSGKDKRPIKYESPRKSQNRAYFPPHDCWSSVIEDTQQRIMITEGEKKAAKACQEGFPTIGLAGVWNWKPESTKVDSLIVDLDTINWSGREVVISFDSDIATNENIQDAESRLANLLTKKGANVRVARIPEAKDGSKVGVDDFLVSHSAAELHQVINAAEEPSEIMILERLEASSLDPMTTARDFISEYATDGGKRTLHFYRDEWIAYNKYVYRKIEPSELRARLVQFVDTLAEKITTRAIGNMVDCLRAACIVPSRRVMPTWLCEKPPHPATECLVAKNKIIHLPTLGTVKNDPALLTVNAVDYEYNPDAECPHWLEFLAGIWSDDPDCIETLQEIFGYLLLPDTSQQKIFLFVGPKRSGKGTIGRIIRELIGRDNVCAPTLGRLAGEFGLQPLLNKTAAIVGDARLSGRNDASAIAEALLSVSGEDPQTVNRKHLPQVDTELSVRFLLLTNELPRFTDASATLPSRFVILKFTKSFFGREDHELTDKLKAELPGILNWAIEGYKRLNERGFFIQPTSADEAIEEMEELASPAMAFVRDCCEIEPGPRTPVDDVWAAWRRWCARTGRKEGDKQTFGRNLNAAAPGVIAKQTRAFGGRIRAYEGLRLVDNEPNDDSDNFYG